LFLVCTNSQRMVFRFMINLTEPLVTSTLPNGWSFLLHYSAFAVLFIGSRSSLWVINIQAGIDVPIHHQAAVRTLMDSICQHLKSYYTTTGALLR
jgi:hypothetical protein